MYIRPGRASEILCTQNPKFARNIIYQIHVSYGATYLKPILAVRAVYLP